MRVLFLDSETTWRGGQNQTRLLVNGLTEKGISCFLAAPVESALSEVLRNDIPCFNIDSSKFWNVRDIRKLRSIIEEHQIDIVDAQSSKAHQMALAAMHRSRYGKLMIHRRVDYKPLHHPFNWIKYFHPRISGYIAVSYAIEKVLCDFGIAKSKIYVARDSLTPVKLPFRDKEEAKESLCHKLGIDKNIPLIGNASALTEQKDYPTLIRAVKYLKERNVICNVVIAGEGHLKKKLQRMVHQLELNSQIFFLGFQEDVLPVLQALDLFVMPSRHEGLGSVMFEALQAGCCIIASDVGGIPELIEHMKTGALCKVGDAWHLASLIENALQSPRMMRFLSASGRHKIHRCFTVDRMVDDNLKAYLSVLNPQK